MSSVLDVGAPLLVQFQKLTKSVNDNSSVSGSEGNDGANTPVSFQFSIHVESVKICVLLRLEIILISRPSYIITEFLFFRIFYLTVSM